MEPELCKFVVHKHTGADQSVHWDLMLEVGSVLQTYRLELAPEELKHDKTTAVRIFDHPLKFLTYEGNLSEDKGSVQFADIGTYRMLNDTQNVRRLQLNGEILNGTLTLTCIEADRWECSFSQGR
ncbi:MAG TPA: DNA polymerase ligase N-terminal domain-containing protein [Sedimentisphaerales bacterium]|nr:DNA polymerase ligase N-terminal domain-containing protein [Sedimentisphaerales bacterium]